MKFPFRIFCCFLTALVLSPAEARGQQMPQYSHYLLNGMLVNPAYAGYREAWYAQLFYHNQWVRTGTPQYSAFALDGSAAKGVNVGMVYANEQMGFISLNNFTASYAYRMRFDKSDLSFGLSAGVMHYGIDTDALHPFEPGDPLLANLANQWSPVIDAGVYYGSDCVSAGLALRNLTNGKRWSVFNGISSGSVEKELFIPAPTWRSVWTIALAFPITSTLEWRPSFMWQEDFLHPSHIDLTTALLFNDRYWVGLSFRTDQQLWKPALPGSVREMYALALLAEVFLSNRITLSYAFDMGLQPSGTSYIGGHEISVGYYFTRRIEERFNRKLRYKKYTVIPSCGCVH
jgi:type IX secretion system PorP/SprF family membrane protein